MKVFLINLDRDDRRLAWMEKQLTETGISFQRFSARTGETVEDWQKAQFYQPDGSPHAPLKPGEVGCYASHLSIHKMIAQMPTNEPVLILEDDLGFTEHVSRLLEQIDRLPPGWEIIRLSNPPKSAYLPVEKLEDGLEVVRYWRVPNNTGAYFINKKGAQKFLAAGPRRIRTIDEDMRRPWEHGMNTYGIVPAPFILNAFEGSSIDDIAQRTDLPWRKRGQKTSPAAQLEEIRHKIGQFGIRGTLACLLKNATISLHKKRGLATTSPSHYRLSRK